MDQPLLIDLHATVVDPAPRPTRHVRRRVAIATAAFLLVLSLCFALAPRYRARRQAAIMAAGQHNAISRKAVNPPAKPPATGRPVYPYSVIPGGAYNTGELARAMDSDPVVARHYGDFDRPRLTTTRSVSLRPVYVSYRIGDTIYWSRKPLRLKMGELLLTDGTNFARGRCGNRIAWSVQSPVTRSEPVPIILDNPVFPADQPPIPSEEIAAISPRTLPKTAPVPPRVVRAGGHRWLVPVIGAGVVGGVIAATHGGGKRGGGGGGGNNSPEVVPEPSFVLPVLAGVAAIIARQTHRRRRA